MVVLQTGSPASAGNPLQRSEPESDSATGISPESADAGPVSAGPRALAGEGGSELKRNEDGAGVASRPRIALSPAT